MMRVLRADTKVETMLGTDADGVVKVYQSVVREDTNAPYILVGLMPQPQASVRSAYGDPEAVQVWRFAVSCWARNSQEAWDLAEIAHEAVHAGDFVSDPYDTMDVLLRGTPMELPDRDTNLRQVLLTYELITGR
jgi:hypothetical protein